MIEFSLIWALHPKQWRLALGTVEVEGNLSEGVPPAKAYALWLMIVGIQLTVYYVFE